ncbi:N-acetylmuramoyl-L-alanine amidase, partial [Thomasclavelia cocleata]
MAIYNIHAGHNFKVGGSSGYFSETTESRNVKNAVISKLQSLDYKVYDCTDDSGKTQNENLKNIVSKCNDHTADLNISIHFNASNGQGHGVEVLQYSNKTKTAAQNICNAIAELGFKNRGVKDRTDLYVLKHTKAPAILIECCFCDSAIDAGLYNYDSMAAAIVKGLTG